MDLGKLPVFNKVWQVVGAGNLLFDFSMKLDGATLLQLVAAFIFFVPICGGVVFLFRLFENYAEKRGII